MFEADFVEAVDSTNFRGFAVNVTENKDDKVTNYFHRLGLECD